MKKIILFSLIILIGFFCFASAEKESNNQVNLAVMAGPTGFSSCNLDSFVNVSVLPSPSEAVSGLINGSFDMAVLPVNKAAALYNSGNNIKAIAIVGQGMLAVIGTNENSSQIYIPGVGDTPDMMAKMLYPQYEENYSISAPAQLAQMVIAQKVELAILPQPFVNMILTKNPKVRILSNVHDTWQAKTSADQYPMSILVASENFVKNNKKLIAQVAKSYKDSIEWVLKNPQDAGKKIEELNIMKSNLASGAIKDCQLVYIDGKESKQELEMYFDIVMKYMPQAIKNKVPDKEFYY